MIYYTYISFHLTIFYLTVDRYKKIILKRNDPKQKQIYTSGRNTGEKLSLTRDTSEGEYVYIYTLYI